MVELIGLFEKWIHQYLDKPEVIRRYLSSNAAGREIGRSVYQYFVNKGELPPIEAMNTELKTRVWNRAKEWATLPKSEMIKLAKIIYLIENLCGQSASMQTKEQSLSS